jgi:hypothetical protein
MEAPRNTEITVPGGATFGGYETNLHMSVTAPQKLFYRRTGQPKGPLKLAGPAQPSAYVFDGRVRWDHIGGNHPSVESHVTSVIVQPIFGATARVGL